MTTHTTQSDKTDYTRKTASAFRAGDMNGADDAERRVFLLAHPGRPAAIRSAELVVQGLLKHGLGVRVLAVEALSSVREYTILSLSRQSSA